jgi:hypothetical protein
MNETIALEFVLETLSREEKRWTEACKAGAAILAGFSHSIVL